MRDIRFYLKSRYSGSRALVIGINQYEQCSPLGYAVNDAKAVRERLIDDFGFASHDVTMLLDQEATAQNIRRAFLRFTADDVLMDDRIVVFFAGHGATFSGTRGEVGYLVPYDASLTDRSTLIRWDELTRNVELIPAKHILFVMDACYGGLAVTRSARAGSARFLRDMLRRVSRQVLTAGKADETVADAGGPIPGHSVFTGHLLQGLAGAAETQEGVLTANGLMSYVYSKVSADAGSMQTPHFGHIDGDGDFVFRAPELEQEDETRKDFDTLVMVPYPEDPEAPRDLRSTVSKVKSLISRPEHAIELHDFAVDEVKHFLSSTSDDAFKADGSFSVEEFLARIAKYEAATRNLSTVEACLAYWGTGPHLDLLRKVLSRSMDRLETQGGLSIWLDLRWYPLVLQTYAAGIAATSGQRYDALAAMFGTQIEEAEKRRPLFLATSESILAFNRNDLFKKIPGHQNQYTPMSEYLFKLLQPQLDDALFLGKSYEAAFDEFEILLALSTADARLEAKQRVWGPIGRFGWKHSRGWDSPLDRLISRAAAEGQSWAPLSNGMFGGLSERFGKASKAYAEAVSGLHWH